MNWHTRPMRGLGGRLKGGHVGKQETVAELTAPVLMHLYGLGDRTGNCWSYIGSYAKDTLHAVVRALGVVERVLVLLLGGELGTHQPSKNQVHVAGVASVNRSSLDLQRDSTFSRPSSSAASYLTSCIRRPHLRCFSKNARRSSIISPVH